MKTDKQVKFHDWLCSIHVEQYRTGHTAIILRNAEELNEEDIKSPPDMEDIAVATINVPKANLMPDEVIIKDYSENEGMFAALILGNVVHMPHRYFKDQNNDWPICKLKVPVNL